ncbi:MAG: ABC transporter permease [Longimicrobiales bacterium]|nr:ABC transporter permease [Longimicrobiales bacterium]
MRWIERVARRLRILFRKAEVEQELDEEVRLHVEMETEDLVRRGMDPARARREAYRRFGGMERTKEQVRDTRGGRLLDDFVQDVRHGSRSLWKSPGFSLSVLLVLALGIGSATALFGVVDAVLLEPLPYPDSERIVRVWPASPSRGIERATFSYPDFEDWRERARTLDGLAVYTTLPGGYVYLGGDEPTELSTEWVAGDFFEIFGAVPVVGRTLTHEDAEGGRMVTVLSWGFWQSAFGGDASVVGTTMEMDHRSFEIVGVLRPGFAFPQDTDTDVWVPLTVIPEDDIPISLRPVRFLQAVGRVQAGASPSAAAEELSRIASELEATYPDVNAGVSDATVVPLVEATVGDVRTALLVALGAVGFILLLACANVANLLLARGSDRAREVALRMSLGAPAGRVVRQLLTESLLLASAGGLLGLGLAWWATWLLARWGGTVLPRAANIGVDATVAGTALLTTVVAAVLAGVLPALRAADVTPADDLREGSRGSSTGVSGVRLRRGLVAAEVALAVLLLTGAGLLVRSLDQLRRVDPGFETDGRIAMILTISDQKHPEPAEWQALYHDILDGLEGHPDVVDAGAIRYLPFRGTGEAMPVRVPQLYEPLPEEQRYAQTFQVSEALFDALGMRLLRGRGITAADGPDDPLVAVVNEAFQREFFQDQDPVGRRFSVGDGEQEVEVIGVVADVRHRSLGEAARPSAYVSNDQVPRIQMAYVVHTSDDPLALVGEMRRTVRELDPDQAISEIVPLDELMAQDLARPRFFTALLGGFAALALVLATLGVYGILAYVVRGRSREMGLRLALGASGRQVAGRVLGQGMLPVMVGLVVGLIGAAALSRSLDVLLFGIQPLDAPTFGAVAMVLVLVAVVACLVPAWNASRVDPMVSLRAE